MKNVVIISFNKIEENNTIEIVKRLPSNKEFACNPPKPFPDKIFKEIWGILDGKIELIETINIDNKEFIINDDHLINKIL